MAKTPRGSEELVTIVSAGPRTSIVLLLNSRPELHSEIAHIMIVGDAMGFGSQTPAAEFNIYVDLETVKIVFQLGIPMVMAGLDATHKAQIHVEDTERFRATGNPALTTVVELLDFSLEYHRDEKQGLVGAPLHDPCTVAWLLKPELFTTVERWVGVEIQGKYTQGMTVVDYYYLTGSKPDATIMADVDYQGFVDLLADRLKLYA